MLTRRLVLSFSIAASAASITYADLIETTPAYAASQDRLEELTKTLAQGNSDAADAMQLDDAASIKK